MEGEILPAPEGVLRIFSRRRPHSAFVLHGRNICSSSGEDADPTLPRGSPYSSLLLPSPQCGVLARALPRLVSMGRGLVAGRVNGLVADPNCQS